MMVMEMMMIVMTGCLALATFLLWRMNKERYLYAERLDKMADELRRLHKDTIHLRDEAAKSYVEAECNGEDMRRDMHKLMCCVDELRWAISTSKAVNKDAAEELRDLSLGKEEGR